MNNTPEMPPLLMAVANEPCGYCNKFDEDCGGCRELRERTIKILKVLSAHYEDTFKMLQKATKMSGSLFYKGVSLDLDEWAHIIDDND